MKNSAKYSVVIGEFYITEVVHTTLEITLNYNMNKIRKLALGSGVKSDVALINDIVHGRYTITESSRYRGVAI